MYMGYEKGITSLSSSLA